MTITTKGGPVAVRHNRRRRGHRAHSGGGRGRGSLLLLLLGALVPPGLAVSTASLTGDRPVDPGPTNGDVGIPPDPMYGARQSGVGQIQQELHNQEIHNCGCGNGGGGGGKFAVASPTVRGAPAEGPVSPAGGYDGGRRSLRGSLLVVASP